jgi:hypothetical protein
MTGRGNKVYFRRDTRKAITDDDKYMMLMLFLHQKVSIRKIAEKYSLDPVQVRIIVGKRSGGGCCG